METNKLGQWARKRLAEVAKEADSRLGKYWIELSYDADTSDLEGLMETDKNRWLKDIARRIS